MATLTSSHWAALPKAAPALYARYGRWLPLVADVLLTLLIARLAAVLLWSLMPTPAAAIWKPAPPATTVAQPGDRIDLASIASANLFGNYKAPAVSSGADINAAPETQLSLTLLGIWANERDAKLSLAIIGVQGGEEKAYRIGEDLSRGVTLQAIFQDRVMLSRNGRLETLRLNKDAPGSPLIAGGGPPVSNVQPGSDAAASLAGIRSQLLSDPSRVSDYIRVQPVNSGNGLTGYRIYPGKDRAVFNGAGLRPGDVVTSINGTPLTDPSKALQLLSDLSSTNQLNLVVERNGEPQNVSVNLNQ